MTEEEIIKEAQRRYPKGTKHYYMNGHGRVLDVSPHNITTTSRDVRVLDKNPLRIDAGAGYIYSGGKWAPLLEESPKLETYTIF